MMSFYLVNTYDTSLQLPRKKRGRSDRRIDYKLAERYNGFAFFTVILLFSGTLVMHVRTLFPSNITSQEEQVPCLQLNESLRPDLTHARLRGCPDLIWIVFPLSRLATDTFSFHVQSFRTSFSAASDKHLFALLMLKNGRMKPSTCCMAKHATIIETVQTIIG
jgi:hypothetical protein